MVPLSGTSDFLLADARTALLRQLAGLRRPDLSKAFAAWVLGKSRKDPEFLSVVKEAAAREGAQQHFQTVAVLGFAAESKNLSAGQLETFRKGLHRQAGREPIVDGVPMAFCVDAVGILGVAVGTKALGDVTLTGEVVRWISKFLKSTYEIERVEDWQRCLFAAADRQLGKPLHLAMPTSVATADVRIALLAKGLVDAAEGVLALEDAIRTLDLALQERIEDFDSDRAALRVAALEWVTNAATKERFISEPESGAYGKTPTITISPVATQLGIGIGITNRPPLNISERLHGLNQLAGGSGVAVYESAGADHSQPSKSAQMPPVQEAQQPIKTRKVKKPVRRNQRYRVIDEALRQIAETLPRTQEEVFQFLETRHSVIPPCEPFMTARGWMAGFLRDAVAARAWLSKRWAELELAPLPRGPKNRKK
jgi:hypothetical protein